MLRICLNLRKRLRKLWIVRMRIGGLNISCSGICGEAPRFGLSKRENHGFGYHCHVLLRDKRAGYAVTYR